MTILSLLLCFGYFVIAYSRLATIRNDEPRRDSGGNIVNAHDGGVYQFHGFHDQFFMYGTVYEDCYQNNSECVPPCGYSPNRFALYVSTDLETWRLHDDNVLPEVSKDNTRQNYWMPNVFRNPTTGLFVMNFWSTHCGFTRPCTELAVSATPYGPFKMSGAIKLDFVPSSQMGMWADEDTGKAYIKYNTVSPQHHAIHQLSPDWSTTVGQSWPIFWKQSFPWNEGGGMFKKDDLYFYMTGGDCCFCQWGADAKVWSARDPLGPWHPGVAPPLSQTLCNLSGDWVCHDGVNPAGKCKQAELSIKQTADKFTFGANGEGTGTVLVNGYVFSSSTPNDQPGVVTSGNGQMAGCERIRWYGDEQAHWCKKGVSCSVPSSYLDPLEINFCADGSFPVENVRENACSPQNPLKGQNFTIPAQQFNVLSFQNAQGKKTFIYYGERSMSAPDRLKSHNFQAWAPIEFSPDGKILPLTFPATFVVDV